MKELVKIYKDRGTEFIEDLFNDYVVITEKLSGSSFSFQKEGYNLYFYKGDNRKPINLIDRTLMVYYEPAISYISSLSPDVFEGVPDNWRFGFQYFVHNAPGAITYDKLPKNNLVLTHILVKDEKGKNAKVIEDPRVIKDWAERLNVTPMQPIFQGHLDDEQKKKLLNFIEVPIEDQMELFGTTSFVAYIIKCLNPTINSTTLHTDLSKPIDSIIFKFYKPGSTQTFSAKMVDPYARSLMKEKQPIDLRRAPADINEIVLLDILAFLEERGLKKHEVLSNTPEEKYLELISALFNDYVEKRGDDLQKLDFQKADFAKGPEFDVNLDLIRNEKTKKLIDGSEALKDLFKVMLGSLRKKRNPEKEGALFTKSIIVDFNKMVDKIKDITKEEGDGKFKTFEDYINLKRMNEELYIKDDLLEMVFEEQMLNYADFINISKFNVNEALRVPHKNQGKKKVNMFAGRFQPFTTGHIKVLEDLHKQNGLPVMVMIVRGNKRDPKRTPFDEDAQQRMVAALQSQYPFIEGSIVVPNGGIDTMFSSLRPTYEPVLWGYGTDRKKSYDGQIQHDSYRAQLGVLPEFQGHEIKRGDEDVSASKVRNALERDDRKGYEKLVPRSLHDFYDELQNIMVPIEESEEINEGKATKLQKPFWDSYLKNVDIALKPKGTKRDELIRAPFGPNDGTTVQKNIQKMFNGVGIDIGDIAFNDLGVLRRDGLGSNDYATYVVTDVDGNVYYVTNNVIELEGGGEVQIRKMVTKPNELGVTGEPGFTSAGQVVKALEDIMETKPWSNAMKRYMIGLAKAVEANTPSRFTDMQDYWDEGEVLDNIKLAGHIDPNFDPDENSRRNLVNDYGEVLDGIYVLKAVKKLGSPLIFPAAGNEALADLYVDPWAISSKSKKGGGSPSINALVSVVKAHKDGGKKFKGDAREQELYDLLFELSKIVKGRRLPTVKSYIIASNTLVNNGMMKGTGYEFFLQGRPPDKKTRQKFGPLTASLLDRNYIQQWLEDFASQDANGFDKWMDLYRKKTGFTGKKMIAKEFNSTQDPSAFFYPLAVETAKILNEHYKEALRGIINKLLIVKQMYLGLDIKKDEISIRSTSSDTITGAIFKARGSAKTFNAGLAYTMK